MNLPRPDDGVVDLVAVKRALTGWVIRLTLPERRVSTWLLHARGCNDQEIAEVLGVSDQAVRRYRGVLGLRANPSPRNVLPISTAQLRRQARRRARDNQARAS